MSEIQINGSVPVRVVARVYGKDQSWVRAGIVCGWLPIGVATRNNKPVRSMDEMSSKLGRIWTLIRNSRPLLWSPEKAKTIPESLAQWLLLPALGLGLIAGRCTQMCVTCEKKAVTQH